MTKMGCRKKIRRELLGDQGGSLLIAMIAALFVLSILGYTITELMATKVTAIPATMDSVKAFYLAESGIQYGQEYLNGLGNWSLAADTAKNMGGGNFSLSFTDYYSGGPETIKITSTGTFGMSHRVVKITYQR